MGNCPPDRWPEAAARLFRCALPAEVGAGWFRRTAHLCQSSPPFCSIPASEIWGPVSHQPLQRTVLQNLVSLVRLTAKYLPSARLAGDCGISLLSGFLLPQ